MVSTLLGLSLYQWDALENKSTVFIYGGGAIVAVWLSSIIVSAINSVPLLPKIMELVGLGYTGWFVYRYLLLSGHQFESPQGYWRLIQLLTSGSRGISRDAHKLARTSTDIKE
ncbi:Protein curvature thylakoid 1A, chloroplastic [Vitis vinifera]|uniref:Protein curvature thylakoid 1A, chloroplastic n=1 Tax=Vitis vinifera TaxID=29760 RepID=A0A438DNY1_VITVI|nr:Protein curvature thylakoid 1A, chloroplastic [Vitis vinifera]